MTRKKNAALELKKVAIQAIQEKKGNEVVCLNLTKIRDTVADYFIIAHGDSNTQVQALHRSVLDETRASGFRPLHVEGVRNGEWVIVDFGDVVVHLFHREKRDFYALEDLWSDAQAERYDDQGKKKRVKKKA